MDVSQEHLLIAAERAVSAWKRVAELKAQIEQMRAVPAGEAGAAARARLVAALDAAIVELRRADEAHRDAALTAQPPAPSPSVR